MIGDDCFIGYGVMFINDMFFMGGLVWGCKELWCEMVIGNWVLIGLNVIILLVIIVDDVVIGVGVVVIKDIMMLGIYVGNLVWLL